MELSAEALAKYWVRRAGHPLYPEVVLEGWRVSMNYYPFKIFRSSDLRLSSHLMRVILVMPQSQCFIYKASQKSSYATKL